MTDEAAAHATLRLGIAVLVAAAVAGVWEVLATQAPGSPLYLAMLPGPVEALRELALGLGVLLLAASAWWARVPAAAEATVSARLVWGLRAGAMLSLGAAAYGAARGMRVEQLYDLRPDGTAAFVVKYMGLGLLAMSLAALAARVLRHVRAS
jgi:hypothetical protein